MDHSLFTDLALPSLAWQAVFRQMGWLLAVAVVGAQLCPTRWARRWWWGLGLGAAIQLPFLSEVTRALALSFQTPSLWSQTLLATVLWQGLRGQRSGAGAGEGEQAPAPQLLPAWVWAITAVLGWVLLLDTLGWTGAFMYAWGFGPAIPVLVLVLCALALAAAAWRPASPSPHWAGCLAVAMGLFVLTRAPSGNAWDAISDPWLWLIANGVCAAQLWRGIKHRFTRPQSP